MELAQRIQAKTDNGDSIIDFLVEVMTGDVSDEFKLCHRLAAARLLSNYGCCHKGDAARAPMVDQAIDFILNNLPDPSQNRSAPGSSDNSEFDQALAKKIQQSTDDGATVCRFLINVMEGELKAFKPHHRISAARELLDRGFGKAAHTSKKPPLPAGEVWGEGETTEGRPTPSHSSLLSTHSSESQESPNPSKHGPDCCEEEVDWDEINKIIDAAKEESDRILAEQGIDPDNLPHKPDYSLFDLAAENSHKWFEEWKNSIDPEEYHAIIKETAERFDAKIDAANRTSESRSRRTASSGRKKQPNARPSRLKPGLKLGRRKKLSPPRQKS